MTSTKVRSPCPSKPLPLELPTGYVVASSAPTALTAELVNRSIVLRLVSGGPRGHHAAGSSAHPPRLRLQRFCRPRRRHTSREAAVAQVLGGGSSEGGSWALRECLSHARGSKKESQEGAGGGSEDEEEDEGDGVNDAEAVERPKGKSRAKRKRVALGEGVASTA